MKNIRLRIDVHNSKYFLTARYLVNGKEQEYFCGCYNMDTLLNKINEFTPFEKLEKGNISDEDFSKIQEALYE
jgi:hypothetical protein